MKKCLTMIVAAVILAVSGRCMGADPRALWKAPGTSSHGFLASNPLLDEVAASLCAAIVESMDGNGGFPDISEIVGEVATEAGYAFSEIDADFRMVSLNSYLNVEDAVMLALADMDGFWWSDGEDKVTFPLERGVGVCPVYGVDGVEFGYVVDEVVARPSIGMGYVQCGYVFREGTGDGWCGGGSTVEGVEVRSGADVFTVSGFDGSYCVAVSTVGGPAAEVSAVGLEKSNYRGWSDGMDVKFVDLCVGE